MGKDDDHPQNIFRTKQTLPEIIILIIIGCLAIIFNIIVIYFLIKKKRRLRSFEILLLNLACADSLVGVFTVTAEIIRLKLGVDGEIKGLVLPTLFNGFTFFSVMSSVLNVICITSDRFIAVKFPLQHRVWVSRFRAMIAEAGVWVCSIFASLLIILIEPPWEEGEPVEDYRIGVASLILSSGTVVAVIYGYIIYTVRQSRRNIAVDSNKKERIVIITCALVVFDYLVCMFPFALEAVIKHIKVSEKTRWDVTFPVLALVYLNSSINPLMYFYKKFIGKRNKKTNCGAKTISTDLSTPITARKFQETNLTPVMNGHYRTFDNEGKRIDNDVESNSSSPETKRKIQETKLNLVKNGHVGAYDNVGKDIDSGVEPNGKV